MLQAFQLIRTYVACVSSRCYKSRFGVAYVVVRPIYSSHLLKLLGPPACAWMWRGHYGAATGHEARATVRARDMEQRGPTFPKNIVEIFSLNVVF